MTYDRYERSMRGEGGAGDAADGLPAKPTLYPLSWHDISHLSAYQTG